MPFGELCYLKRDLLRPVFYDVAGFPVEMPDPLEDAPPPQPGVVLAKGILLLQLFSEFFVMKCSLYGCLFLLFSWEEAPASIWYLRSSF
jgi:hypothetical protein